MNYYFSHARTAFKYGLLHLGFKPGDNILIPDYICDVLLHPLKEIGVHYKYYSINDKFEPIWNKIENCIDNSTKGLLMVHYFGQPQDIVSFQSFCKKHKLKLIEDNAHGFGGICNGQSLGTFGDIGITSIYKNINVISGGVLYLKNEKLNSNIELKKIPISINQKLKVNALKLPVNLTGLLKKLFLKRPNYEDLYSLKESPISDYMIDEYSKKIIEYIDMDKFHNYRKDYYSKWESFAVDNKLNPVFKNIHPDSNPWCFPAYVNNQQEAINWFNWGWKNNVHVFSWPSLPKQIIENNKESVNRWKNLICFGISKY